jgi:hypothetical protein
MAASAVFAMVTKMTGMRASMRRETIIAEPAPPGKKKQ